MNPAGNERNDNKDNMKKAQREKENAEREGDEHWMHRSSGDDVDDENEKPLERKGSSSLGKNSSESHQKDTGNIG